MVAREARASPGFVWCSSCAALQPYRFSVRHRNSQTKWSLDESARGKRRVFSGHRFVWVRERAYAGRLVPSSQMPQKYQSVSEEVFLESQQPYLYSHIIFFQLSDRTPATRKKFIDLTWELLATGHPGMIGCAIGFRDVLMQRPVNNQTFDISVDMTFESREAYEAYRVNDRHERWITLAGSMSIDRAVYDAYLVERKNPVEEEAIP